ncbi:hypothetical protein CCR82_05710 [Halochromatium salexigens]|uniref:Uncharacterized protein n=1 Tax=Halochromatium salexigens TaxID=49447 RepID=A0AAJ0UEL9_HALSE|nr:hypothetical protein [Halochromatium salexigens]
MFRAFKLEHRRSINKKRALVGGEPGGEQEDQREQDRVATGEDQMVVAVASPIAKMTERCDTQCAFR